MKINECKLCELNCDTWYRSTRDFGIVEMDENVLTVFCKEHITNPSGDLLLNLEHSLCEVANREFGNGTYRLDKSQPYASGHYHINAVII